MSRKYYVYAYLDPATLIPFYIGKGFGKRDLAHITEAKAWNGTPKPCQNVPKVKRIRELLELNTPPIVTRLREFDDEQSALSEEVRLIASIGRGSTGPLLNQTDGGEGTSGYRHQTAARAKMSADRKGKPGHKHSAEYRASMVGNDNNAKTRKKVYKIAPNGTDVVTTYASLLGAVSETSIPKATLCSNIGAAGLPINGFFYRYTMEVENAFMLVNKRAACETNQRNVKPVQQLLDGKVVATFDSIKQAAIVVEALGGKYCTLWTKLKTGKPYLGFTWRYT